MFDIVPYIIEHTQYINMIFIIIIIIILLLLLLHYYTLTFSGHKAHYWTFTYFLLRHPYVVCRDGTILDKESIMGQPWFPLNSASEGLSPEWLSCLLFIWAIQRSAYKTLSAGRPWKRQPGTPAFIWLPNVNWQVSRHQHFVWFLVLSPLSHKYRRKSIPEMSLQHRLEIDCWVLHGEFIKK